MSGIASSFPGNGCNLSSSAHELYLSDKMKMPSKLFSRFPSEIHSYKSPATRFDFETCSAHVYSTKSNATNKSMH